MVVGVVGPGGFGVVFGHYVPSPRLGDLYTGCQLQFVTHTANKLGKRQFVFFARVNVFMAPFMQNECVDHGVVTHPEEKALPPLLTDPCRGV